MIKVILASKSPRRYEILSKFGAVPEVYSIEVDESIDEHLSPSQTVLTLAKRKAMAAVDNLPGDAILIAADTVVALDDEILGKPKDEDDAFGMLRRLSGKTHRVYTGVAAVFDKRVVCDYSCTEVTFYDIDDEEIKEYIASGEPMDKAGAYGIQGGAGRFVKEIKGEYYNVVGLPIVLLDKLINKEFNLKLFNINQ